jgi:undecaprenyl-diphosphatase
MNIIQYLDSIDKQLFLFLNGLHCSFLDVVMWHISQKLIWVPLYLVIIGYIIRERKWKAVATLIFIALMIVISDQVSGIIKDAVLRFRPSHNPEFSGIIHILRNYKGGDYGFVSSHAANSFAIAIFITLFFRKRWVGISIFIWAAIVSYSRIYLGVHYPFDVLGGAMVGILSGLLIYLGERWFNTKYFVPKTKC